MSSSFFLKCISLCFIVLAFTACSSTVRTTVSTYTNGSGLAEGAVLVIQPKDVKKGKFDELEFGYFAESLGKQLKERGYHVTEDEAKADYRVFLQYDTKRQKRSDERNDIHVHGSYAYRYRYGSVVVLDGNQSDRFEYARRIKLTAEEIKTDKQVISLSGVSYGRCEHLASVYDEIVTALLNNLHRENGAVTRVKVKSTRPCLGDR